MVACKTQTKSETSWFSVCDLVCVWFSISVCDFSEKACFIKASWCSSIANWFPFFRKPDRKPRFAICLFTAVFDTPISSAICRIVFMPSHSPHYRWLVCPAALLCIVSDLHQAQKEVSQGGRFLQKIKLLPVPKSAHFLQKPFPLALSAPRRSPAQLQPTAPFPSLQQPTIIPFRIHYTSHCHQLFFFIYPIKHQIILHQNFSVFVLQGTDRLVSRGCIRKEQHTFRCIDQLPRQAIRCVRILKFSADIPHDFKHIFPRHRQIL